MEQEEHWKSYIYKEVVKQIGEKNHHFCLTTGVGWFSFRLVISPLIYESLNIIVRLQLPFIKIHFNGFDMKNFYNSLGFSFFSFWKISYRLVVKALKFSTSQINRIPSVLNEFSSAAFGCCETRKSKR